MKLKWKFLNKKVERMQENWFPEDPIVLKNVLKDTFWVETSRPVVRLVIAIFISAFMLVLVKNAYHQAFMRLQALKVEQAQLHTEWMQLLIEEGTWGNYDRISQVATSQLNMSSPTPFNTQILVVSGAPSDNLKSLVAHSTLSKDFFDENGYFSFTLNS